MIISWIELLPGESGMLVRLPTEVDVPENTRVGEFLALIGLNPDVAKSLFERRAVSVFGVYARVDTQLHPGDRVELLDALASNPMESRRRRAALKREARVATGTGKVRQ